MPLRRLALLTLAACVPAPGDAPAKPGPPAAAAPAANDAQSVSKDSPAVADRTPAGPVPKDSAAEPVPKDSTAPKGAPSTPVPADRPGPPRLLHAGVSRFGALADGAVLIEVRPSANQAAGEGGLRRLAPADGALTPWPQPWRPRDAGWKVPDPDMDHGHAPVVSPDARWVALLHSFAPLTPPARGKDDVIAVVVSRADGSEPRCVGTAILEDESEDIPPLLWTRDSARLLGGWSGQCEPDARGHIRSFPTGARFDARKRPMRSFAPQDGSTGEAPGVWSFDVRDPLGDRVVASYHEGGVDGLELRDLVDGKRLGAVAEGDGEVWFANAWVSPDAVLADIYSDPARELIGHRTVTTAGTGVAAPGVGWRVYTRLANDELLFTRDRGASVEQGRIDWTSFTVESSRPRPDLAPLTGAFDRPGETTWTPGLGGVLIHFPQTGPLHLAPI